MATKRQEIASAKEANPEPALRDRLGDAPPVRDFFAALRAPGPIKLIAEVKKASPSKGLIRADFQPLDIARAYARGGATCLSVLTDVPYFQGSLEYLKAIRQVVDLPLLRKDFMIDRYQVVEARLAGADAILLIAECLDDCMLRSLLQEAHALGMAALVEFHEPENLTRVVDAGASLIGINNRDLTEGLTADIYAGGGMGRTPILGSLIKQGLPWQLLPSYLTALLRVYNRFGRRDNLYKARIKILVKALGPQEFARQVEGEWAHIANSDDNFTQSEWDRVAKHFTKPAYKKLDALTLEQIIKSVPDSEKTAFTRWYERNVRPHQVPGYASVVLSLKPHGTVAPGDVTTEQMLAIADLADEANRLGVDIRPGQVSSSKFINSSDSSSVISGSSRIFFVLLLSVSLCFAVVLLFDPPFFPVLLKTFTNPKGFRVIVNLSPL